ncbi:MAG: aminotransferase class I/II-fold pyridoxal phosphate-dependent enzyme [Cyanobacteriota bacterium]
MILNDFKQNLNTFIEHINNWQQSFPEYSADDCLKVDKNHLTSVSQNFLNKLENNYPFHHPLYAGQMLKSPHPIAIMGYIAAMMINPNNHSLDGGPATAEMEKEIIKLFANTFGFQTYLGHLTTSGTIANLEALWISRELHPDKYIAFSDQAHYTHGRVCKLLNTRYIELKSTPYGKLDLQNLEKAVDKYDIGTLVVTLGTTSLGALDELDKILTLKNTHGFRIHIDGAYGAYYKIISQYEKNLNKFDLISKCDSIAFDPHKLGLQPYGCGSIIFSDPDVGCIYKHDSPYTYFTSKDLHLGEISLECSRAGAAAAALWLTLQCFSLNYDNGFGPILKKQRQAAISFARNISNSNYFKLYIEPEIDILNYFPIADSTEKITYLTESIFDYCMNKAKSPLYLAKLKVPAEKFRILHPEISIDSEYITILRSCLLKPEHSDWVDIIVEILESYFSEGQKLKNKLY